MKAKGNVMRKIATIAAAITLASAQLAAAAPVNSAPTTASVQRVGAPVTDASQLRGRGGGHIIVYLGALTAVILGIIAAARNHTPRPTSP